MKLIFDVDSVLPCVGQCVSIVNTRNSLPILCDLFIESNDLYGDIVITASDGQTWISVVCNAIVVDKGLKICVNATDFFKALQNLKGRQIEMSVDDTKKVLNFDYNNGSFQLPYHNADEYPKPLSIYENDDNVVTKHLKSSNIFKAVKKVCFAVACDELRPIMNGVHFDFFKNMMVTVASDGQKLAKYSDIEIKGGDTPTGFTLPQKPSTTLINLLSVYEGNIKMMFDERIVVVKNESFKLTTRLIEGRYPNYDSVIPKTNDKIVTFAKDDFVSALKRVIPMSNSASELVSLKIARGVLTLSAIDIDFSKSASEDIKCDYMGDDLVIGFKGSSMLGVSQNIDCEQIEVDLKDQSCAGLFKPAIDGETTSYISLLMPMLIY